MDFHYGLGTHFNAWVPQERLNLMGTRFTSGRIDAQGVDAQTAREYMTAVEAAGMFPIVIFGSHEQQEELPDGAWVEALNEVNIGLGRPAPMPANQYSDFVVKSYEIAKRKGQTLLAGAAANMENRDIQWFHDLQAASWPEDIIAVTHHYTPRDTFGSAHILDWNPLTWNRQYEVDQFQIAIGRFRKWVITEFGYQSGPNSGLTPEQAARQIALEWPFWKKQPNCLGAWLYQINDSPVDDHDFGLHDEYGNVKDAIFSTVPQRNNTEEGSHIHMVADIVIHESCLIPLDNYGKPGKYSAYARPGDTHSIIAIDNQGNVWLHSTADIGRAYESFSLNAEGDVALFDESGPFIYGVRVVAE